MYKPLEKLSRTKLASHKIMSFVSEFSLDRDNSLYDRHIQLIVYSLKVHGRVISRTFYLTPHRSGTIDLYYVIPDSEGDDAIFTRKGGLRPNPTKG